MADGISSSYPCTNDQLDPSGQFCVLPAENNREEYVISDLDLEMDIHLLKAWLEEPAFDLVSWYRQHLDQHEYFEQRYYEAHQDMYFQIPSKDDFRGSDYYPPHGLQSGSGPYVASEQCGDAAASPELEMGIDSVLRSGPVRFFCYFWTNRNRNRLPNSEIQKKPDWNRKKPQKTAKNRSEPVQMQPVKTDQNWSKPIFF